MQIRRELGSGNSPFSYDGTLYAFKLFSVGQYPVEAHNSHYENAA